ncbi:exosome complex exonuclease RRP40 [Gloeopeniophorella convolvens]|nr:exosome complex exonuclease RRP40 [Gloeopeniophorella convolvens]
MSVVLPGELVYAQHKNIKLGPGLQQVIGEQGESSTVVTRAGTLEQNAKGNKFWVEGNSRRYVPAPQEPVVGIISARQGEGWRVDIGSAHQASLDGLAFEGASRRNRPNLKVNALVYARVSLAHKDMDPELECFDAQTRKADGFGELKGGFLVRCSLKMSRNLLDPNYFLLPLLGSRFPLDAAVGMNGRVWISAKEVKQTIAASRCIDAADPDGGCMDQAAVKKFLNTLDL